MTREQRDALIKFIRENTKIRKAWVYDAFGNKQRTTILPLWYSDTQKLCYPEGYFDQRDIDEVVKQLEKYVADNKLNAKVEVQNNYYIGGLHSDGWRVRLV